MDKKTVNDNPSKRPGENDPVVCFHQDASPFITGFKMLLENSAAATFIAEPGGRILIANAAACALFGFTSDEFCAINFSVLFEYADEFFSSGLLSLEKTEDGTLNCKRKNGSLFSAKYCATPLQDKGRPLILFLLNAPTDYTSPDTDIKMLMNHTEETFILINNDLVITGYNKSAQDYYEKNIGVPLEKGRAILDYSPADRREKLKEIYEDVFEGKRCVMQVAMETTSGETNILRVVFIPVKNDKSEVTNAFITARDVTRETLRLKELEKTQAELDRIMSDSLDMICTIADDDKIVKISASCLPILGYLPAELVGKKLMDLIHPDDLESLKKTVSNTSVKKKGLANYEARYRHKNGSIVYLDWTATWNEKEKIRHAIARNITDKKRSEERMFFEKLEKEALINSTEDLIWSVSQDLKLIAANSAFTKNIEKNIGIKINPGDHILLEEFPKEFLPIWMAYYNRALLGESFREETSSIISEDGSQLWVETAFDPIYANKKIIGIACCSRDITSRKMAEQRLKESESRLIEAQAVAKVGSWQTDLDTLQVIWSPEMFRIFEIAPSDIDVNHQLFLQFTHPDDRAAVDKAFTDSYRNGLLFNSIEHRIITGRGTEKIVEERWKILMNENKEPVRALGTCQDITERKNIQSALTSSKENYKKLFENSPAPMFIWDIETFNIVDCNLEALLKYGYTREEFLRLNIRDIRPPEDVPKINLLKTEEAHGRVRQTVWRHLKKNGELLHVNVSGHIIDYHGRRANLVLVLDITEKVQAEEKLEQNEAFLAEAQRLAKMGSWNFDIITGAVTWSDELFRVFGTNEESFGPTTFSSLIKLVDEADRNLVQSTRKNAQITGEPFTIEYRISTINGEQRTIEEHGYGEKDGSGKVIRLFGTAQNITERKTAEQRNRFKATLLNTIGQATIATDINGNVTFWNLAAEKIYGWTEAEAMSQNIMMLTPTEQTAAEAQEIMKTLSNGQSWQGEFLVRRKSGEIFPAMVNNSPIYDETGKLAGIIGVSTDISEQKKIAAALAESNNRYRYATQATFDAIWDMDLENEKLYWGDNYVTIFGQIDDISATEFERSVKRLHPEEAERLQKSIAHALKSESSKWSFEHRYLKQDGSYAFVSNKAVIIRNEAGRAVRAIGAMQDITLRKKRDEQLKLLESVIVNTSDSVLITEADAIDGSGPKIIYANDAFTRMTGYTLEEVKGKTPQILQGPKSDRKELDRLKLAMNNWERCKITIINYKKNGEEFWINFSIQPVANENGVFTHWISIERDVTEQRMAEETIRSINERYNLAAEATNDVIWDWNLATGEVIRSKEAMKKLFGFTDEEDMNSAGFWEEREHPDDKPAIKQMFKLAFADPTVSYLNHDYRFKKADGSYAYLKDKGFIIRNEKGEPIRMIGAAQDISELKEIEFHLKHINAELENRARELDYSNKELEQFAYVASHDLQEPLRMVSSFLTQIDKKYTAVLDEQGRKYIHFAVDGAKRMRQIILDLLEYSRANQLNDELETVDLNELLNEIQILLRKKIEETNTVITYDKLPSIMASTAPIRQVFQNLVANAMIYSRNGEAPQIKITANDKKTHWEFSVADNGIGVNKEYFEKIFILFQRLHTRQHSPGTGMGLALAKKIITHFGGSIWLKSAEGLGSTFYFTIPKKE